jgi:hypothetical protein
MYQRKTQREVCYLGYLIDKVLYIASLCYYIYLYNESVGRKKMAYDETKGSRDRYYDAIDYYRMENARKGKMDKWLKDVPDAQEICDFLHDKSTVNSLSGRNHGFLSDLHNSVNKYGSLTENQTNAVRKIIADNVKRAEALEVKKAAEAEASDWVGVVGDRIEFDLTVQHVATFDGHYGTVYFNICKDADDNVVVYKGSNGWEKSTNVKCVAKIKEHSEREGVKQTIIQRPTVKEVI